MNRLERLIEKSLSKHEFRWAEDGPGSFLLEGVGVESSVPAVRVEVVGLEQRM